MEKFKLNLIEPTILPEEGEEEIWKQFTEEPTYEVSSFGRIRNTETGCIRALYYDKEGYATINFGKKKRFYKIHRVVAKYFCEGYDEEAGRIYIDHIDRCHYNNYYKNLRFATRQENRNNIRPYGYNFTIKWASTPIVLRDTETDEIIQEFSSINEAHEITGLSKAQISSNIHRARRPFKIGYFTLAEKPELKEAQI